MGKLIILRGNSGSGKTSVAKELQKQIGRNTLVLSQDTIRRELLWARDGYDTPALSLLIDLLHYGHKNNEIVILEGILNSKWYRPLFEEATILFGKNIYAYYYDLPFEETLKRHKTRGISSEFGEKEMKKWWNEKDYIGFIPEKTIGKDISLNAAVNRILSDILTDR